MGFCFVTLYLQVYHESIIFLSPADPPPYLRLKYFPAKLVLFLFRTLAIVFDSEERKKNSKKYILSYITQVCTQLLADSINSYRELKFLKTHLKFFEIFFLKNSPQINSRFFSKKFTSNIL